MKKQEPIDPPPADTPEQLFKLRPKPWRVEGPFIMDANNKAVCMAGPDAQAFVAMADNYLTPQPVTPANPPAKIDVTEILRRAIHGQEIGPLDIVSLMADETNWERDYTQTSCRYVWVGPNRPPYEFAQKVLEKCYQSGVTTN